MTTFESADGTIEGLVNDIGLGYIRGSDQYLYAFTFDKIDGYGGEYPKELTQFSRRGLRKGVHVTFSKDEEGLVRLVEPR